MGKQIKHNEEQKRELVEKICALYESETLTIESCCESYDITVRTFNEWVNQNSEHSDRYKRAKHNQDTFYKQRLRLKAKTSLEKMIEGYEYEESHIEGKEVEEETGEHTKDGKPIKVKKFKPIKVVKKKMKVQPNPTLVMYALNNSNDEGDKTFNHASKSQVDITTKGESLNSVNLSALSDDELIKFAELNRKISTNNAQ